MANTSISNSNGTCVIAHEPFRFKNHQLYITVINDALTQRVYTHSRVVNSQGKTVFALADFDASEYDVSEAAYQFIRKHPKETQLDVFKKWAKRWGKAPRAERLFIGRREL